MSDGQLARVSQTGYTESEAAESVANVAMDLLTNFPVAVLLLDVAASSQFARG